MTPLPLIPLSAARNAKAERVKDTEKALRVAYGVVLPSILKHASPGWGPGPLSTERSWEFFCSLAEELGDWNWRIAADQDLTGASIRRVESGHREEAVGQLVTLVRRMPTPIRIVVEARSCGVAWQRMTQELPDRAYFSMTDDWAQAVGTLAINHESLIRRLS